MTGQPIEALLDELTERDLAVLRDVERFRLLGTRQVQRLHFDPVQRTPLGAARSCTRTLARLREHGVLRALDRRIGGVRAGSSGNVWYVGPAGERVMNALAPAKPRSRSNYGEPSRHFVEHTLAVAEAAVQVIEASRRGDLELLLLEAEPASWQQSLSAHGTVQWLKPDLHLITATDEFEHHRFIEIDLATEHVPVIVRQCQAYQRFRASGAYQAAHGLFPAVLWVVPGEPRKAALRAAVGRTAALNRELFQVCTMNDYLAHLTNQSGEEA